MEMDSIATPSPSQRKNRRVISDDGDYIAIKKENCIPFWSFKQFSWLFKAQPEDDIRPLRRLKRMKDIDEESVNAEPNLAVILLSPMLHSIYKVHRILPS